MHGSIRSPLRASSVLSEREHTKRDIRQHGSESRSVEDDPYGRVIARARPAAHIAIDAGILADAGQSRAEQQMVEAKTRRCAASDCAGSARRCRCARPDAVPRWHRSSPGQPAARRRRGSRLDQGVIIPGGRRIDVDLGRRDIVVAGQHDRHVLAQQLARMRLQAPEPGQLVVEFRARLRIAVGQIDAADEDAVDGGLDVAAWSSSGSPGREVRVTTGSEPRERMATPFQVRWPRHTA